mmetsp:Transcript_71035/g.164216  ORF Transcript_71035/g.164216 Transcript_71035/m.164216 type:complete len:244 (+) Transcript_71035:215-946(+)
MGQHGSSSKAFLLALAHRLQVSVVPLLVMLAEDMAMHLPTARGHAPVVDEVPLATTHKVLRHLRGRTQAAEELTVLVTHEAEVLLVSATRETVLLLREQPLHNAVDYSRALVVLPRQRRGPLAREPAYGHPRLHSRCLLSQFACKAVRDGIVEVAVGAVLPQLPLCSLSRCDASCTPPQRRLLLLQHLASLYPCNECLLDALRGPDKPPLLPLGRHYARSCPLLVRECLQEPCHELLVLSSAL